MSRPFDEARYKGLLEGLEISELKLSAVREHNEKLRIDSGYFAKPMLQAEMLARSYRQGHTDLGTLFSRFAKGIFDINADAYTESGVPFVRIGDLRAGMIDERGLAFIPEEIHASEAKTELLRGDVVLSKTAYPAAALVTFARGNTSQDTIAARLSSEAAPNWRPEAIVAYLCSVLGQRLMWRQFQGNVQLHLSLDDARKVPIPRFGQALQAGIAKAYVAAEQALRRAEDRSANAERKLLAELGLAEWNQPQPLHYVRRSSEAFAAGRLDAEYFSPVKQAALDLLASMPGITVGEMFESVRELWQPEEAPATEHVVNYDLNDALVPFLDEDKPRSLPEDIASTKKRIAVGDLMVSRLRSYLKEIAVVGGAANAVMVASTEFFVLRSRSGGLHPEALMIYLRSLLPQVIFKWSQDGSNHPRFDERELLNLRVPQWVINQQEQLRSSALAAKRSLHRAQALLAAARRAIEIAIEDSEEGGLQHLQLADKLHRQWAPLKDQVRVELFPDLPLGDNGRVGFVIPDSATSKDDDSFTLLSPGDVLSVLDAAATPGGGAEGVAARQGDPDPLSQPPAPQAAPDPHAELLKDPRNVPLWFGTNREPNDGKRIDLGFSGRRSTDRSVWHGRCIVNVPQGHALGSTGTGGLKGWWQRWRHGVDDRLRLLSIESLGEPDFWQAVRAAMNEPDERKPEALLFLHGYRVSFEDAALRAAQLAYDLKIRDAAFFSWPSAGAAAKYTVDEGSAKNATEPLAEFISALDAGAHAAGKALHVIAHSMGNRVLLAALQWLVLKGRAPQAIDKIVCAAPDEDADDFVAAMAALRGVGRRRTLYASSKDKPVWLSEVVHGYPRAGRIPPVTLADGLDTVDASDLEATFLGHSDFATERPLLQDLFSLLKSSLEPRDRLGLEPATTESGAAYWRIK